MSSLEATPLLKAISDLVERRRDEAVSFLQSVIRVPSPSGQEEEAAKVVSDKMGDAGFAVEVDGLKDVMAVLKGAGRGRSLLLNGHIDHVPAGNMVDPYSGKLIDGAIFGVEGDVVYGRAASDMKGALAAMVMAGDVLAELGVELMGDFKVAAVVEEPFASHPGYTPGFYDVDLNFGYLYQQASSTPEGFADFLDEWVFGVEDRAGYIQHYIERFGYKQWNDLAAGFDYGYPVSYEY